MVTRTTIEVPLDMSTGFGIDWSRPAAAMRIILEAVSARLSGREAWADAAAEVQSSEVGSHTFDPVYLGKATEGERVGRIEVDDSTKDLVILMRWRLISGRDRKSDLLADLRLEGRGAEVGICDVELTKPAKEEDDAGSGLGNRADG